MAQALPPPSLPGTLPGGAPLPALPPGSQQDILQRILDASGGRVPPPPPARGFPLPTPPQAGSAPAPGIYPAPEPARPAIAAAEEPLSPAEAFFAARLQSVDPPLRQFGYDTFRGLDTPPVPAGALPDDYVLGRGDEVILAFRGRARQTLAVRVDRDGQLLLPDLPPVQAAGRTLGELRADLEARAARDFQGSEVFVSIGDIRQLSVFVGGEVARPGFQTITGLSTVLDAIAAAGGVRKTGSLRAIRVESAGASRVIDLYPILAGTGGAADLALRPGERIVVPAAGALVAIAGDVARPAIYELRAGVQPLGEVLELAGGALRASGNRYLLLDTDAQGRRVYSEVPPTRSLRRGDALVVQPGADVAVNQVRLSGHVAAPITRARGAAPGLRALVRDPRVLLPDPYPRFAVIWRMNQTTRVRTPVGVDLGRALSGRGGDVPLGDGDEVVVFSASDIAFLSSPAVQRALRGEAPSGAVPGGAPGAVPLALPVGGGLPGTEAQQGMPMAPMPGAAMQGEGCPALTQLAIAAAAAPLRFAHARGAGFPDIGPRECPQVFIDNPDLLAVLLDASVLVTGEVRRPGLYPIVNDTGMDAVLAAAGGAGEHVDLSAVELSREPVEGKAPFSRGSLDIRSRNFAAVRLSPRDALRIPRAFGDRDVGTVLLAGEFVRPGAYDVRRGERLSELIARAGGLTPQAFPYGAVFTRESVRIRQQEGFERTARELEAGMVQAATAQASAGGSMARGADLADAIRAGREFASSLRQARAAGRMVIEANPVILAARPELDVLMEPGDQVVVPKRPNEVTVVGSVLNPGSLQFNSGWKAAEYVKAAGGAQRFADPSRAFVVLPNGAAAPAGLSGWMSAGQQVPPGSLVVVPQDPAPWETWGFIRDITQVLGQLSISAAALAVISRESR